MIAYLDGTILFRGSKSVIVDVSGVGYRVSISRESLKSVGIKGNKVSFFTHMHVRENAMELYGFTTMSELEFFEMLIGISGIGPKSAINILSLAPPDTIKHAISTGDSTYLTKISGVGKKIAEKITLELKDKLSGSSDDTVELTNSDAIDALVSLGYTIKEARDALAKIKENNITLDQKIKEALKNLGR